MKKPVLTLSVIALSTLSFGQARLVLNNDAWLRIDNGAWVVVENPAVNAVTTMGTGGNIRSEGELNRLRWQTGATIATYVVPFTTPSGVKMPLTYNKTSAGVGGATASTVFSTYNYGGAAPSWDNFNYRPSDVTHMNNFNTGLPNNSGMVVDRFWDIDTYAAGYNYTTRPNATLTFVYDRAEVTAGNTITNNTLLQAQRFNSTTNKWGDYQSILGGSICNLNTPIAATNQVSGVVITGAGFYRSWTLSDLNDPLPIELVDFRARCEDTRVVISWTTATEQENDYFTIEKSADATTWEAIGVVDGAGNSIETIEYSFTDLQPTGLAYYRLSQTDFDGTVTSSYMIAAGCDVTGGIDIVSVYDDGNDVNVLVSSSSDAIHDVTLLDAQSKVMAYLPKQMINTGITHLRIDKGTIATGLYVIRLNDANTVLTRKVMLN